MLFNGSRAALGQAVAVFPGLHVVLVTAPAEVLARRLAGRGRETRADIEARLARAGDGLPATLPPGLKVHRIGNDGPPETGIARLLAVLQPVSG